MTKNYQEFLEINDCQSKPVKVKFVFKRNTNYVEQCQDYFSSCDKPAAVFIDDLEFFCENTPLVEQSFIELICRYSKFSQIQFIWVLCYFCDHRHNSGDQLDHDFVSRYAANRFAVIRTDNIVCQTKFLLGGCSSCLDDGCTTMHIRALTHRFSGDEPTIVANYDDLETLPDQVKELTDVINWCVEKYCRQKYGPILLENLAVLFDDNPVFTKLYKEMLKVIKPDYKTCACGTYFRRAMTFDYLKNADGLQWPIVIRVKTAKSKSLIYAVLQQYDCVFGEISI